MNLTKLLNLVSVMVFAMSAPAVAQSLKPVFEQNSVDGHLLGAEGSLKLFQFLEPSVGLAYGLQSQQIRYQVGLGLWDLKLSVLNWPGTPVLGRVGQSGLLATFKRSTLPGTFLDISIENRNSVTAFFGTLWPWVPNESSPDIVYVTLNSSRRFLMPFGIELNAAHSTLYGWWRLIVSPMSFQYSQTHLELRRDSLTLSFSYGTLQNEGRLPDFEFIQSVKGDPETIKGEHFWALRFERSFDLLAIPLNLPPMPVINRPIFERILFEGAAFLEISATSTDLRQENGEMTNCAKCSLKPENLLSWGMSVILSLNGFKLRADVVFKRDGEYRLLFGS